MNYEESNEFQDKVGNRCFYQARASYRGITNDIYTCNGKYVVDGIGTPTTEYDTLEDAFQDFMTLTNVRKADEHGKLRLINPTLSNNSDQQL